MEYINFVPQYPILGHVIVGSGVVGFPTALAVFIAKGGPQRSRQATFLGLALAAVLIVRSLLLAGNSLFVWHVIGMSAAVFAFQPAAYHAILSKQSFTDPLMRTKKVFQHKTLQLMTVCSASAGFLAIYLNKPPGFPGKHFMSVHALVGAAALFFMLVNTAQATYMQGHPLNPKLLWVSVQHRWTGTMAVVASSVAASLGLYNRTVVVDWAAEPTIAISWPQEWHEMNGWAMKNHGPLWVWGFIFCSIHILIMMLSHGKVPKKDAKTKKDVEGKKSA